MALDPKVIALLTAIEAAADPAIDSIPVDVAREQVEKGYARMKIPKKHVGSVRNVIIPGPAGDIPLRIYTPEGTGPFPVILFFHGGGWVLFDLDAYDPICSHLCAMSECVVISVDYRRSPEYKFPAATNDCLAATYWAYKQITKLNGDPSRMFLAGDSAGGNLATVTAMRVLNEGGPVIKGQILIYPVTDYYKPEKHSYVEFANGFSLTKNALVWFWDKYLNSEEDSENQYVSPLRAKSLSGLPSSFVIVSGYDPLRDEAIAYAKRLEQDGVNVYLSVYGEMIHGFVSYLGILKQAKSAIEEISGWVKLQK